MPVQKHHVTRTGVNNMDDSLIELQFDENEEKIMTATLKAFESGTLTPLIKEELRCTIQSRRLAEGKGELQVEFKSPVKKKDMTDDERLRALKRRQQNREAAQRFRQRQKDTSDYLSAKIKRLETNSKALQKSLNHLKKERDELKEMLQSHLLICTNRNVSPELLPTTPSAESTPQISMEFPNQPRGLTDSQSTATSSTCPDTGDSYASVFFSDVSALADAVQPYETSGSVSNFVEDGDLLFPDESVEVYCVNGPTHIDYIKDIPEECYTIASERPLEGCYEEIVIDAEHTDSECGEDQRLDSCSSLETSSNTGSWTSETPSLSESTSDLRHSMTFNYLRVHKDSFSSSDPFQMDCTHQDFLLQDDVIP